MKFPLSRQTDFDKLFWVPVEVLRSKFDVVDLDNRIVVNVTDGYLETWFEETNRGRAFIPPTVHLVSGKTQFISGRHRTAVLERHLEVIPMAFDFRLPEVGVWITGVGLREVGNQELVDLPELPYLQLPSSA